TASTMMGATWTPLVDVVENEREVRCEVELPGVPRDRISVTIAGDSLLIRGERPSVRIAGGVVRHQERALGAFYKIIALPPRVRRDGIEAALSGGVLVVTLPLDGALGDSGEVLVSVK